MQKSGSVPGVGFCEKKNKVGSFVGYFHAGIIEDFGIKTSFP
jgi:hypothetical protein